MSEKINWYTKSEQDVENVLKTNIKHGLDQEEVNKRQQNYGYNEIKEGKKKTIIVKFLEQFKDFMIIVLMIAAIISGIIGSINGEGITDTVIIMIVIIANAIIGVAQECRAEKSLEALKKLSSHTAKVIRNGAQLVIPSRELVKGDIVILDTGDYVPADLRIIESVNLKVQESALTGESVPVEKMSEVIAKDNLGIADRTNMLFTSSLVTYGRGKGIVVETGMDTEVGKIAEIINNAEKEDTPLSKKLDKLGKELGIIALAICIVIFLIGIIYGKEPVSMFMTAVSLAVAAIPEGLAAVSTIVLAIGVQRMVKKNAIIKKLPAVETLGSTTVICSDKTGTLTQNKMTVKKVCWNDKLEDVKNISTKDEELTKLIYTSMLCNDTKIGINNELIGDPTETALVDMAFSLDFNPNKFGQYPRMGEIPFDSERKLMTTINSNADRYIVYTKGGIDELLARCNRYVQNGEIKDIDSEFLKKIKMYNNEMAKDALRVLGMAYKNIEELPSKVDTNELEKDLIFIGLVGMVDPPRVEVKDAVQKCKTAGIRTVMITGDHKTTAVAIAKELGIIEDESQAITGEEVEKMTDDELKENVKRYFVYARVAPEHKVRIVKAWQSYGEVVAMTGDGVNDAPALKTSNIGCAMGITGTDVSKEAADVILTDDNFATIVSSVEEGRRIYDNILKAVQFLLSSNIGEIVVLFISILIAPLLSARFGIDINKIEVFLVTQLLWINLVTDSLPALALANDPPESDIMNRKPNKSKGLFTKGMTWRVVYQGVMIGLITLIAFIIGLSINGETLSKMQMRYPNLGVDDIKVEVAQTMAFTVIAFSELIHVFNIRDNKRSIFKTGISGNKMLFIAVFIASTLMITVLLIPSLQSVFGIIHLPKELVLDCILLILSPIAIVEVMKLLKLNGSKEL